jgi:cobalt/nickel transport system permease protein
MVHMVDGALSGPVVAGATALAAGGVALGLKRLDVERIPQVAVLGAVFFVSSLVHVPVGPASAHLMLAGLMGVVLGWVAFPAVLIGLLLQAVLFGFGGVTVLGVNTLAIALPAIVCGMLCGPGIRHGTATAAAVWGFAAGALSVALIALLVGTALALSGGEFVLAAKLLFATHVPVMVVEGLLTAAAVVLVRKVKPELFHPPIGGVFRA